MGRTEHPRLRKRFPVVNGIFYPESKELLHSRLESWGLKAGFSGAGRQVILAPHGAWDLTGSIAASAFAAVQKRNGERNITRILLLGTHHHSKEDGIYLSESASFGPGLSVDQKINRQLSSCSTLIKVNDIPHLSEHSLEVLLPMIQYCFPKVKIIPILMGGGKQVLISCLAKSLKIVFEQYLEESLIVISSTVSQNPDPAVALSMAEELNALLKSMDAAAFHTQLAAGRISACGGALIGALLESGLVEDKQFSSLSPLAQGMEENGETVYYGAFGA